MMSDRLTMLLLSLYEDSDISIYSLFQDMISLLAIFGKDDDVVLFSIVNIRH